MTKHDELALQVMETWQGTIEELGAALHDATEPPMDHDPAYSKQFRAEQAARRSVARCSIMECEGGMELILLHEKEKRG